MINRPGPKSFLKYNENPTRNHSWILPRTHARDRTWRHRCQFSESGFIDINPVKDNTLYEYVPADGDRSNGIGDHFFAGKTAMGYIRRGVLAFDIAGSVPPGSTITSVSLTMHMSRTALSNARTVELHRLLADWGEGTSDATANEGQGAPATANDATWRHRFYNTIFWTTKAETFPAL